MVDDFIFDDQRTFFKDETTPEMCIYRVTTKAEVETMSAPVEMLREVNLSDAAYEDTTFETKTTNFYFD